MIHTISTELKTVLLTIWNDLLQELIDIMAIISLLSCVAGAGGHSEHSVSIWVSCRQLTIITETFKMLMKSCAKSDLFFMKIFNA